MKRTLTLVLFTLFSFICFSQTNPLKATGGDICLGFDVNYYYNEMTWTMHNGAPIWGNFEDSATQNRHIGWNFGKWTFFIWDWSTTSYVYLYENPNGTQAGPPPLTGWVPMTSCTGLTAPTLAWALPVDLVSFEARQNDEGVILNWETASETNNEGFEIQRSEENRTWDKLGFVDGQGTTSENQSYEFIDYKYRISRSYYRLKQMDYDGNYEYSDIKSISPSNNRQHQLRLYPNPAGNLLNFSKELDNQEIAIFNIQGKSILKSKFSGNTLDVSHLQKGNYILKITDSRSSQIIIFQKI